MNTYILTLYVFAVPFVKGDAVEVQMVAQKTLTACTTEGRRMEALYQGSNKALRFTCVKRVEGEV